MTASCEPDPIKGLPIGPIVSTPPARPPDAKILVGQSVRLEPLNADAHGEALWETTGGLQNSHLWQYMSEGPFPDRDDFDRALALATTKTDPRFFAIIDQKTSLAVGRSSYLNIRPEHGVIEVGHLLFSHLLQRTRGATEALYLMTKYAFEDVGYRRYEWKCDALNLKSKAAAQRFGFKFEGTFRQHMIIKGRSRDSAWFSILDLEWPIIKSNLESWLALDNFDSEGNQLRRLSQNLMGGLDHAIVREPEL